MKIKRKNQSELKQEDMGQFQVIRKRRWIVTLWMKNIQYAKKLYTNLVDYIYIYVIFFLLMQKAKKQKQKWRIYETKAKK